MAEVHTCSWSPAVGNVTVTRDNQQLAFEYQRNGNDGAILGSVRRQTETYDLANPGSVTRRDRNFGFDGPDVVVRVSRSEQRSINYNRCANDLKTQGGVPVDFIAAVRSIARGW